MDDHQIVDLYWKRSETAIAETAKKFGNYCYSISFRILHVHEDAEECVNDTYLRAWGAMPPQRPHFLSAFLGKITRNLSINRYRQYRAEKRGFGEIPLSLSELEECIPAASTDAQSAGDTLSPEILNRFLKDLPGHKRIVFVQRYWYLLPIKDLAQLHGQTESQVKSMLFRLRKDLKAHLEQEGVF